MLLHVYTLCSPDWSERLRRVLDGAEVQLVPFAGTPLDELAGHDVDLVVARVRDLPDTVAAWVDRLESLPDAPGLILLDGGDDPARHGEWTAAGCLGVLSESLSESMLGQSLKTLIDRQRERLRLRFVSDKPQQQFSLGDFVSDSPRMREFLDTARRLVRSDSTLLLLGETGVGKGRLARAIHEEGPRSSGPFVPVHCAALPETLLESELFGHEAGAFTGAERARKGLFEMAHGGTLFLDEVGEIPLHTQAKLLTAIEERSIRRLGSDRWISVDVRLVAATNRDLDAERTAGRFRADLYFRLAVVTLTIPPLRDRRDDVRRLVLAYLEISRQQMGRSEISIDADALDLLVRHEWPGNVRELINTVERAVLLSRSTRITIEDLPSGLVAGSIRPRPGLLDEAEGGARLLSSDLWSLELPTARAQLLAAFERTYLERLLAETGGRIAETARRAGVNERHLYDLMRRYGLRKEAFRGE